MQALLNEQGEVEHVADQWAALWQEGRPPFIPPHGELDSGEPPLTGEILAAAAMTFPINTGLGADNMAPRAFAALPQSRLQQLAELLNRCGKEGRWPRSCELVLIVLLPKTDGGKRPIGLFPSIVRPWMRARANLLRTWENELALAGLYGTKGMAATRAAWTAAARAEAATTQGKYYAQVLLALEKAFESVPHQQLWEAAPEVQYPMAILRLALAAYRLPRTISCDGVCSRTVTASRGITAGSGTATSELRTLTLKLLARLRRTCPQITTAIYVDDVNLEAEEEPTLSPHVGSDSEASVLRPNSGDNRGTNSSASKRSSAKARGNSRQPRQAAKTRHHQRKQEARERYHAHLRAAARTTTSITSATNAVIDFFEDDLKMKISGGKSKVVANLDQLARHAASLIQKGRVTAATGGRSGYGKMLGAATTGGKRRITAEYQKRVRKLIAKKSKFRVLRTNGISCDAAVRATAMPAVTYGMDINGVADIPLGRLRSQVGTLGRDLAAGGSMDADWYARETDSGAASTLLS